VTPSGSNPTIGWLKRAAKLGSTGGRALAIGLEAIPDPGEAIGTMVASEAIVELDHAARSVRERCVLRGHEVACPSTLLPVAGSA
jgi:hypothetical protein